MAKVKNLAIKLQSGTDSTYFASWAFEGTTKKVTTSSSSKIKVGDYVKVKSGSKWYNGVGIASFVFNDSWKVIEINGSRAVLGRNKSGTNNIMSPININNLIGGSGSSSSTTTTTESESTVDHYTVKWYYDSGDSIWFEGGSSDTSNKYATYSAPSNASRVKVLVRPVAKTRKVNGKDTAYWSGTSVSATYSISSNPPEVPPSPTVELDKYELTATIDNVSDPRSDEIQFQIYDMTTLFSTGTATVSACMASYKCKVNAGGRYRVRARAANIVGSNRLYSDWTEFTSEESTIPSAPTEITTIRATSSTSVYLEWPTVNSAKTYTIEYTTKLSYFDNSNQVKSVSGIEFNHYEVTGLETGDEYFFRVQAVNEQGESAFTEPVSVTIGKAPAAPTTWSSSTTVITGDPLNLYWVHNAKDGSTEEYAEVEIRIGDDIQTYTVKNELADDEENEDKDKTKHYTVDTSQYTEGTQIKWRVRTAGITLAYGDWSIQRTVDIYAPPTLELTVTDQNGANIEVLNSFPFFIKGLAGPNTQEPIGYYVSITADEGYQTVDSVGQAKIVNAGDEVYTTFVDTNDPLLLELSANNIDLENNVSYSIIVVVSMNSGLNTTATKSFSVSWQEVTYDVDAEIGIDSDTYVAYINPYCYYFDDTVVGEDEAEPDPKPVEGVSLAVYRREFDGTFTEIATGISSETNTVVTDPHPSLDYARYRIVATSNDTGAVSFYDPPGYPVQCPSVIIQWDEEWSYFDISDEDAELAQPPWSGSLLELKYNVDTSDNSTPEVSLVNYIGRTYPVAYYGTSIDSTSTWNMEIPKDDVETLYALRRLSIWKGNAYVREPSGSGYWANVAVSFSQKHNDLTIPITLDITRVEGGM